MWTKKINKKSFTLVEIVIVTIIISLVYYFSISNLSFKTVVKQKLDLINLPKVMKSYSYENTLILRCINEGDKCLVYSDGKIIDEFDGLFKSKPIVYSYDKELDTIYFDDIELKHLDRYEVCFEYKLDKYNKAKDLIMEYNEKIYIYNSFYNKAIVLDYISDVSEYFEDNKRKVRDAF